MAGQKIATLVGRFAAKKKNADRLYSELRQIEADLIMALRSEYPEEWSAWERGRGVFKAEGVTIKVTRTWDIDKVRAEIGEERPDLFTEETRVVEKVDGRKLASLIKDASYARRLEGCIKPQVPRVSLEG